MAVWVVAVVGFELACTREKSRVAEAVPPFARLLWAAVRGLYSVIEYSAILSPSSESLPRFLLVAVCMHRAGFSDFLILDTSSRRL